MKNPIIKSVLAIILSIVVAVILFMLVEGLGSLFYPFPEDFGGTPEEIASLVENSPAWVLALLGGLGYGAIMFVCTFLATRLGANRNPWHGYGIGLLLFAMVVYNLTMLPYPSWYWVMTFVVLPLAAFFGTRLGANKQVSELK